MAGTELLTITETAQRLSVSTKTVRRWIKGGRLRAVRLGPSLIRVKATELDTFAEPIPAQGAGFGY